MTTERSGGRASLPLTLPSSQLPRRQRDVEPWLQGMHFQITAGIEGKSTLVVRPEHLNRFKIAPATDVTTVTHRIPEELWMSCGMNSPQSDPMFIIVYRDRADARFEERLSVPKSLNHRGEERMDVLKFEAEHDPFGMAK